MIVAMVSMRVVQTTLYQIVCMVPDSDLGGWFEFTDHVGLNWHITKQFTVGWRYQHMSNAGIYARNPGLNLQMLSVSYSF